MEETEELQPLVVLHHLVEAVVVALVQVAMVAMAVRRLEVQLERLEVL